MIVASNSCTLCSRWTVPVVVVARCGTPGPEHGGVQSKSLSVASAASIEPPPAAMQFFLSTLAQCSGMYPCMYVCMCVGMLVLTGSARHQLAANRRSSVYEISSTQDAAAAWRDNNSYSNHYVSPFTTNNKV